MITQDYAGKTLNQALLPVNLNTLLPGVHQNITLAQQVALATNADVYGRQSNFIFAFTGAIPWTKFVPGTMDFNTGSATPDWEGKKPFFASLGKVQQNHQTKSMCASVIMSAYHAHPTTALLIMDCIPHDCFCMASYLPHSVVPPL